MKAPVNLSLFPFQFETYDDAAVDIWASLFYGLVFTLLILLLLSKYNNLIL